MPVSFALFSLLSLAVGEPDRLCGIKPLDQVRTHRVSQGETLDRIATQYQVLPETIMGFNPPVRNGTVKPGQILQIPPTNGIFHRLANDENYRTIAQTYNVRADLLFEQNACQRSPEVVFVPGVIWKPKPQLPNLPNFAPENPLVIIASGGYPLPYVVPITSGFGWRTNPVTGEWSFHSGTDLGAPYGTPALATSDGVVEFAGWGGGYGNLVEIRHPRARTRYAHLSQITVTVGQKVIQGQQIGLVGSTGRSTGPHLHFEILSNSADGWVAVDPAPYLNRLATSR